MVAEGNVRVGYCWTAPSRHVSGFLDGICGRGSALRILLESLWLPGRESLALKPRRRVHLWVDPNLDRNLWDWRGNETEPRSTPREEQDGS